MRTTVYTIEDEYLGIPLTVECELVDYENEEPPFMVIQEIAYKDKPLEMWCFKKSFINHLENKVFQLWCNEAFRKETK